MASGLCEVAEGFGHSNSFFPKTSWSPAWAAPESPLSCSNAAGHGAGCSEMATSSGGTPPQNGNSCAVTHDGPPGRVFLRLPDTGSGEPWLVPSLNYWKLQRLISPGRWNKGCAPVRAYVLRRTCATRGIVLVEHADIIRWLNECFRKSGVLTPPIPAPQIALPPVLRIPAAGEKCPYTSLTHGTMFELSRPFGAYGLTQIYVARYLLPGSAAKAVAIETQSLLRYIRSLPPPNYKIAAYAGPGRSWARRPPR